MYINDNEIDLTLGHKFQYKWEQDKRSNYAYSKITKYKVKDSLVDIYIGEVGKLPWNMKEASYDNFERNRQVRGNDYFSTEANCIVRTTSSNTIWMIGSEKDYIRTIPEVREEFLLEVLGYIPFTSVHRCINCGKLYINPMKTFPMTCRSCGARKRIPWEI